MKTPVLEYLNTRDMLVEGAFYLDSEGDIIGPMKALVNKRWTGRNQYGRRKVIEYFLGGRTVRDSGAHLIGRVADPETVTKTERKRPVGYNYREERHKIFTESGQKQFLSIRDRVHHLIKQAGAVRMQEAIAGETGDSWTMLACVDRLVELGEITEITAPGAVPGQHRIFTTTQY